MKQTLILLLTLALFVVAVAMQAQTSSDDAAPGALHGLLIDVTGRGIPDAVVTVAGTSISSRSNACGEYRLAGLPAGEQMVSVSFPGSEARRHMVVISSGIDREIHFSVDGAVLGGTESLLPPPAPIPLDYSADLSLNEGSADSMGVVIVAQRVQKVDASKTGYSTERTREDLLRQTPTTINGAIARSTTVNTSGGGIGIRGGRANEASIRRDGFEVSEPVAESAGPTGVGLFPDASSVAVAEKTLDASAPELMSATVPNAEVLHAGEEKFVSDMVGGIDATGPTFRSTTSSPLSTFSIDVDNGSYTNVRGYLTRGEMPPPSIVRIEEMMNYVRYDYPQPSDDHPFAFDSETIVCPWNRDNLLVRVALQGREIDAAQAPPSNLVFLIDVSGSMGPSDRLPLLKESFRHLIAALRPQDSVAIVVYAGAAGVVLEPTSGAEKHRIHHALCRLESGGSTAGGAGIRLAYDIAQKHFLAGGNNRVILATDGDFNVGVSSESALVTLIEEKRKSGVFLSVLGFGTRNFMDAKMESLADHGNGNYYYIDKIEEGARVLGSGMSGTIHAIAKDVKLQIRFNPASVAAYRLLGYENRTLAARDFADDTKDAGELGAGHQVTALYEIVPIGAPGSVRIDDTNLDDYRLAEESVVSFTRNDLLQASLRYKRPADSTSGLIEHLIRDERHDVTTASRSTRLAATIAAWGMMLQQKSPSNEITYDRLREWLAVEADVDGESYVAELRTLIDAAERAAGAVAAE